MSQRLLSAGKLLEVNFAGSGELVSGTWKDRVISQLQDGQTIYPETNPATPVHKVEIGPSARSPAEAAAAEQPALPPIPRLQCKKTVVVWANCPQCGGQDLRIAPYDGGTCSQTGYRDSGERWECRTCGAIGDEEELDTRGRSVHPAGDRSARSQK